MARGKYRTSAEAREAREGALSEVEAGRRMIVKLTKENEELQGRLNDALAAYHDDSLRLRQMIAAGTSPEVEALRAELACARQDAADASRVMASKVHDVLKRPDWKGSTEFHAALMEVLDLSPDEYFGTHSPGNRYARRATVQEFRGNVNINKQMRNPGAQVAPDTTLQTVRKVVG